MDVVGSKGTGILQQKIYLEAETANCLNNNLEQLQGDMAQTQVPHVDHETEVGQLFDSMEASVSGSDEHPTATVEECLEAELSDIEDKWDGSADENRDSFSDRSDSPGEVEDQEVQCLQVGENLDVDDQGIFVDDQISGEGSDEDEQEVNAEHNSGILYTDLHSRQNEDLCFGDDSVEHARLALDEFKLKYEEICSVAAAEQPELISSPPHSSESEMSSPEERLQECELPHNCSSEEYTANALGDMWRDHQKILARKNEPISRVGAEDTLLCVKRKRSSTGKTYLLYNNADVDDTNCYLGQHTQANVVGPEKEDNDPFKDTERLCHTLDPANALKELSTDHVSLQQKSANVVLAPACKEINNLENDVVAVKQDDMRNDFPVTLAFAQEPVDFGVEELNLIETDKSEVQSQNSQEEAQQASSETEEDLDIDDDRSQSVDILGEAQPFLPGSIFCPPGARNYEYRLEDNYDGVDDKVESRDFIGDRGRDISDKLDPEILHLLELHLQKQQLVVIEEEEEEEEEESDFDSFHVNSHKLHFESFGPSRKRGQLLDMVLEEPELLEEKEQEEDDLSEVQLDDTPMLNSDLKEERNPCEVGHNGVKYAASGGLHPEDVDVTDAAGDMFKGVSDNILKRTLYHNVQEEFKGEDQLQCCSEGVSHLCQDMDHGDEPCSVIDELPDFNHRGQGIDRSEVQDFELKNRLLGQFIEITNSSCLRTGSLPFYCQQSATVSESKTHSFVCNAFCHDVDICDGVNTSPGSCKTTELTNMVCFDDVMKHCGQKSLILNAEGRDQAFENTGWPLEMSSDQLVSSTPTEQMNHANAFVSRPLESMPAESPSCQQAKIPFLQQKINGSGASTDLLATAAEDELEAEVEQTVSVQEEVMLPLRRLEGVPRGLCLDLRTISNNCSLDDATAPEKGPDVYQQLAEALEWAQASERRNSQLHGYCISIVDILKVFLNIINS